LAATAESLSRIPPVAELDDPTIVAIFDGANTADVETGMLAAERGHTAVEKKLAAGATR
jgi:putative membrane protein